MKEPHSHLLPRRRLLSAAVPGLAAAAAVGLVVHNQIRHPYKDKHLVPDGKRRRLVLAAPSPQDDPPLLAARDQGIFDRYNLDVTFLDHVTSGRDALDRLQSGHADGAIAAALSWLPRLQAGLDARLVCGLQAGSSRMLIARGSKLRRIEDLYRKVIGITDPATADRLFFSIMMRRKGMNPNRDVTWQVIPAPALGLALAEGQVQAIVGHDPAIWQLRESLHLGELASSMSGSYAIRVSRVLGVRTAMLAADPKGAVAIALAIQDAAIWSARHPREISVLLASGDPNLTDQQAAQMLRAEGADVHPMGVNLRNQIAQYTDEMKLIGLTSENVDSTLFAKHVTADLLKL